MTDILKKLEEETRRIEYEKKREYGNLLTEEEITSIFEVLKKEDFELKPVLELIERNLQFIPEDQYMIKEETIKSLLTYYKILENKDFLNIRHKLFFTESRVMVKKPYFSPETTEKIKEKIKTIFEKI